MTTFIRVVGEPVADKSKRKNSSFEKCEKLTKKKSFSFTGTVYELERKLQQLKLANQKLQRNSRGSVFQGVHDHTAIVQPANFNETFAIVDEPFPIRAETTSSASQTSSFIFMLPIIFSILIFQ